MIHEAHSSTNTTGNWLMCLRIQSVLFVLFLSTAQCVGFTMADDLSHREPLQLTERQQHGREIYANNCAHCHGEQGEGVTEEYAAPLIGDRSVGELTDYIDRTMPDDEAELCVGEDAKAVADYISTAFYSEIAQVRNQPPRVELLHLTRRQYENSIVDLTKHFSYSGKWSEKRGLQAVYRHKKTTEKRIDDVFDFDFGDLERRPEKIRDRETFSVWWDGGIRTESDGIYEFEVDTTGGTRLEINGKTLFDKKVRSGDNTIYTGAIKLLGRREYPVVVEYRHGKGEPGKFAIRWKPPHKTMRPIPNSHLSIGWFPKVPVIETTFPPDDSSFGYERGVGVSKPWDEATTRAALEYSEFLFSQLEGYARVRDNKLSDEEKVKRLRHFYARFHRIAHRLTTSDADTERLLKIAFEQSDDLSALKSLDGLKRFVLLVLKHPHFLYPATIGSNSRQGVASQLALVLWDSLPDSRLASWASQDRPLTIKNIRKQCEWMVKDPRATAKMMYFMTHWMELERAVDLSKDPSTYPDFDAELLADLRHSLELFVSDVIESPGSDYRELLQADFLYVNNRMADYYGFEGAPDDGSFAKVQVDPSQRCGILTHPYLLSGFAYHKASSPIHRGVFLARNVLGRSLRPPPVAVAPLDEGIDESLTTRERVDQQTRPEACQSCHTLINPLGFGLENYDAVGRFREREKNKPINAAGKYLATDGEVIQFTGPRELTGFLVEHPDTHRSFVEHSFHQFVQQSHYAYGRSTLDDLVTKFVDGDFSIRKTLTEIATTAAMPVNLKKRPAKTAVTTTR